MYPVLMDNIFLKVSGSHNMKKKLGTFISNTGCTAETFSMSCKIWIHNFADLLVQGVKTNGLVRFFC